METTTKKEVGLKEAAELFSEAMEEKFFRTDTTERSLFIIATDGDDITTSVFGQGMRIINSIGTAMANHDGVDKMVGMAVLAVHGNDIKNKIKKMKGGEHELD